MRTGVCLLLSAVLFTGCAGALSERERNTAKGAAGGAVLGGSLGFGVGGLPGAAIGAPSGAILGAIIGADQPLAYRGTIIMRQVPPPEQRILLAFIPAGDSPLHQALKVALAARGWRVYEGLGRPNESTLFDVWQTTGGVTKVETFSPDGRRYEGASQKSVEEALDQVLARMRD